MKYAKSKRLKKGKEQIALIYAQGQVGYGSGSPQVIGQGTINSALRRARNNDNIKAVVLRVNSPGGSALTSDLIWREVQLTREVKPVVVSFGDVAASGGYYIGVAGTKIFAEPTTITGSIGVFGTIPNFSEFAQEIGINAEQVGTNKNSVDYSIFEPMSNSFRAQVKEGVERTYDTFLSRVAEGREMTVEEVDKIAQGRVWSGAEAVEIGLVDELGSLEAAIEEAAKLAEMSSYRVTKYPRFKSEFERLMDGLGGAQSRMAEKTLEKELGSELYKAYKQVKNLSEAQGVQAHMPFQLNIK
jgi:protease-4